MLSELADRKTRLSRSLAYFAQAELANRRFLMSLFGRNCRMLSLSSDGKASRHRADSCTAIVSVNANNYRKGSRLSAKHKAERSPSGRGKLMPKSNSLCWCF